MDLKFQSIKLSLEDREVVGDMAFKIFVRVNGDPLDQQRNITLAILPVLFFLSILRQLLSFFSNTGKLEDNIF